MGIVLLSSAPLTGASGLHAAIAPPREVTVPHHAEAATALASSSMPGPARPGTDSLLATINVANQTFVPGPSGATHNFPSPLRATYDSANHRAYVIGPSDQVLVVNESSHSVLGTIVVGAGPSAVLYGPGTGEVFVANFRGNDVSVINDTSDLVIATVPIPSNGTGVNSTPELLVWDGVNHTVLVQEFDDGAASTWIAVLDPTDNQVSSLIGGVPSPVALTFNAQTDLLYDLSEGLGAVVVLNLSSGLVQGTWTLPPIGFPTGITVDPLNGIVFVATSSFTEWANVTAFSAYNGHNLRNITVFSGATAFGFATPVYSSATGNVYLTAGIGLLYAISAVTLTLSPGTLVGTCLGPMVLSGSGAPLLLTDSCASAIYWVDGVTAVVLATTPIGATPTDIAQVGSSRALAIVEPQARRVDFVNGSTLAFGSEAFFPSSEPVLATSDPTTSWAYTAETGASGDLVTALDPDSGAVMWSWLACANCRIEGLGDQNGSVLVSEYRASPSGQLLAVLSASTGVARSVWPVAYFPSGAWDYSLNAVVTGVPNATAVVTSIPGLNVTIEVDAVTGHVSWARPTGENMSGAAVLGDNATVVLAAGNDTGELEFVQLGTGAWIRGVPLPTPVTALTADVTGTTLFLVQNGNVLEMNASGSNEVGIALPAGAVATTVRLLAGSGGIAAPAPALGAVFWVGAPVSVAAFAPTGNVEQATTLTLVTTAIGGFGTYHYSYSGLPEGCASADAATLTCTPLDAGAVQASVTVTDATPTGSASGVSGFTLEPYPLNATISIVNGSAQRGFAMALKAVLPLSEASFASYLNFSWAVVPGDAATFNRTNASATTVTFTGAGDVSIQLTLHLRSTAGTFYENLTIATGSTTSSLLSGTALWIVLGVVAVVIVLIAVLLLLRGRRRAAPASAPPPPEASAPEEPPAEPTNEGGGEVVAQEPAPNEPAA